MIKRVSTWWIASAIYNGDSHMLIYILLTTPIVMHGSEAQEWTPKYIMAPKYMESLHRSVTVFLNHEW